MKKLLLLPLIVFFFMGCGEKEIKQNTMFALVKGKIGKEAMVLEIGASSCKTCIEMKKTIDTLKLNDPNLPIYIVDVYDDMNAFSYFKIQMIPTQLVFNAKGEEVSRHIGGVSREEMLQFVELSKK